MFQLPFWIDDPTLIAIMSLITGVAFGFWWRRYKKQCQRIWHLIPQKHHKAVRNAQVSLLSLSIVFLGMGAFSGSVAVGLIENGTRPGMVFPKR